ncbi:MAG TPA: nucleotidyltransferase domain-containing protein [candidate division Zixibacteria bacterium]|nr:nucleotidyltransferase domain-containing protein [candidate division Zixibacteria bacterium]
MITFPEKLRRVLERTVKELAAKGNVYGVGLFGSWSRGDEEASSDVDLFILEKEDFAYEYVERVEEGGFLIDLNHVPKRWIQGPIPPEIDQKLFEIQIFYDRDWALTNTKLLMAKSYGSPERVDIRTDAHVVESDIYLSRATSALARHDFRSSHLFATVAFENALKVLVEIALQPFSNSRFMEKAESSGIELGMHDLFGKYVEMTGFGRVNKVQARDRVRLFKSVWDDVNAVAKENLQTLGSAHFKVRTRLSYYLNPGFLQGVVKRASAMIEAERTVEVVHYLSGVVLDFVENYAWLKSLIDEVRIDYTTLIRSLEGLEGENSANYRNITTILGLDAIDRTVATEEMDKTREAMLRVRRDRKLLIKNHLLKT